MQFGNREFRPRLWPTVATLILLPVLLWLGFWQLDRAQEKREIEQRYTEQQSRPAVGLNRLDPADKIEYRRVTVRGHFADERQILLDNQIHQGQAGYHILTPLQIEDSHRYILVNRGWVNGSMQRSKLPEVNTPDDAVALTGRLKMPAGIGIKLGDQSYTDTDWPRVVQWLDIQELEKETGYELYPYILQLDEDQPHGFVREWKIVSSSPEQSTSYAVQWFTLALVLVLIFIFVNSRKIDHAEHERK
ncbi:SURF1 family protein [Thiohalophilus thiocyanatoxydans]|uniref:SURF1-like protein n=1 Tax=Thiohalophilus thiocyanatoxydans TaxID=381308 RepID=A0A4R8ISQ9_9GAMM|nr:SURF1 family protein [Thiohalophilus thiocyanatoxydans]TDY04091.1 surfeit locus 1 family protein [Thiohalophilus thiocyanatoxydans]